MVIQTEIILKESNNITAFARKISAKLSAFFYRLSVSRIRGFDLYLMYEDRVILEDNIIPYFVSSKEFHKILFVGCDWYTKPYRKIFKNKEYWTIEIEESRKKYGSSRHIVDGIQNLDRHIENGYFDVVFFNGVFGFGLDAKEDTEEAFNQCYQALRPGGILVFGWNDVPQYRPFPVMTCTNLKKFEPYIFAPLSTAQYLTHTHLEHTFNFYIKPKTN